MSSGRGHWSDRNPVPGRRDISNWCSRPFSTSATFWARHALLIHVVGTDQRLPLEILHRRIVHHVHRQRQNALARCGPSIRSARPAPASSGRSANSSTAEAALRPATVPAVAPAANRRLALQKAPGRRNPAPWEPTRNAASSLPCAIELLPHRVRRRQLGRAIGIERQKIVHRHAVIGLRAQAGFDRRKAAAGANLRAFGRHEIASWHKSGDR